MAIEIETFTLPAHWAPALINGDASGLDDDDARKLERFINWMAREYGRCWPLDVADDAAFTEWHDARSFGVLACDCATVSFDVHK
jgi:hypothetical protein